MVMKAKSFDSFYLLCEFRPGKWGFQIINRDGSTKSAYSPGDGSWQEVMDYLRGFTTRYKGTLPWMQ